MTQSYLGAYWGPRAQSVDDCATLLAELITKLAGIDPLLSGWRSGANSKRKAMAQPLVTVDHIDLVQRLMAGQNRNETGGAIIEELGYHVGWWNGENNTTTTSMNIHLGATTKWVSNSVMVKLADSVAAPSLYTLQSAQALLTTVITIFSPDRAVWTSSELTDLQSEPDRPNGSGSYTLGELIGHPAGWATFLADSATTHFDLQLLPDSARVERVGDGTLVLLGDDPADPPLDDVFQVRRAMGYPVGGNDAQQAAEPSNPSAGQPAPGASGVQAVGNIASEAKSESTPMPDDGPERAVGGS